MAQSANPTPNHTPVANHTPAANRDHLRAYLSGVISGLASARVIPANASLDGIVWALASKFASDVAADGPWAVAEVARHYGALGLRVGAGAAAAKIAEAAGDHSVAAQGAATLGRALMEFAETLAAEVVSPPRRRAPKTRR